MAAHVTHAQDEIRHELMLNLKTPILNHTWTAIALGNIRWATKAPSEAAVLLGRVKIRRRRVGWYAGAQQDRISSLRIKGVTVAVSGAPTRRGRKAVGERYTTVAVAQRSVRSEESRVGKEMRKRCAPE